VHPGQKNIQHSIKVRKKFHYVQILLHWPLAHLVILTSFPSKTRKQSEPADLCQGHVVRQVAAPYSVWQQFPLCPIESNVNENFKVIQNPGFLPDHLQN